MSILTRQLPVAAVAAVAIGAGAAPALASTQHTTSAATAKTPLVAKIKAEAGQIRFRYLGRNNSVGSSFSPGPSGYPPVAPALQRVADAVDRIHADGAQLTPKLAWVLGVWMEGQGINSITDGQQATVYGRPTTGRRDVNNGIADWRLSNYLIAHADSTLGIPHPARNIEPEAPRRGQPIPSGPGTSTLSTPTGLATTITMGDPALQEIVSGQVETTFVNVNEAALRYYTTVVGDMRVDGAQRVGQQDWLKGAQTQLRGDELLGKGETTHSAGNPLTGNSEMRDALGMLREANSEIAHADSLLGVHTSGRAAVLPAHTSYYRG